MSFLKRHKNQEDASSSGDNEELYERLFTKIGRDFVYKEDLQETLSQILIMLYSLNPTFLASPVNTASDAKARLKAMEYKNLLDSGKDGSKIYRDLIKLDDEADGESDVD
jgi:hypothetical protein